MCCLTVRKETRCTCIGFRLTKNCRVCNATFSKGVYISEFTFVIFQGAFAAITCGLIVGAFAERAKFSAILVFMILWFTFSYLPMAHMVWYWAGPDAYTDAAAGEAAAATAGFLFQKGALDFAGGTVVHINAAVAGLIGAFLIGKRVGYGRESMAPHSLTFTMIGASLLWFGWFGFNAGSALEASGGSALAMVNTWVATACAAMSWMLAEWLIKGKPSMLGAASGAVAGLVAITPAAGFVGIKGALVPMEFGKAMSFRDPAETGDIKYLWEPNRHLELVCLAQAWQVTGDSRYLEAIGTALDSWFVQCPYPLGANWSSALEAAVGEGVPVLLVLGALLLGGAAPTTPVDVVRQAGGLLYIDVTFVQGMLRRAGLPPQLLEVSLEGSVG